MQEDQFSARVMRENLLPALTDAAKAVSKRATLPVLANVLLEGGGDDALLSVTGADLEVGIRASCPDGGSAGRITANARDLLATVKALPKGTLVLMEGNAEGTALTVNGTILPAIDAEEYPIIPQAP